MVKPYKLPDGSYIFKGKHTVYRPVGVDPGLIQQIDFKVESRRENIPVVMDKIEDIIKSFPFKKDRLVDFAIAVSEAVQNAILHHQQTDHLVWVNIIYLPRAMLYVCITDDGGPLNVQELNFDSSDPEGQINLSPSGRGFFLMTSLSSVVAYVPDDTSNLKEIILGLEPEKQ